MPKGLVSRGVLMNWGALAISFLVGFLLFPFVVSRLGDTWYGVWTLVNAVVSYLGLLDFGLRGAVTRFVSRDHVLGDHGHSSDVVSTALWLRLWSASCCAVIGVALSMPVTRMLRIPVEMQDAASLAIGISVASFTVNLTCGVFGGVLAGKGRFDLLSAVAIGQSVVRALGVIWLLNSGYGIMALAWWDLTLAVLANGALAGLSFRVYPELRITLRWPDAGIVRELWGYGVYAFLINTAVQFVYYTDALVVSAFLSAATVTVYAIGGGLIEYLRQLVSALSVTFTPFASRLDAAGRQDEMRRLLIWGTRVVLFVALPVEIALWCRGRTFIGLWMGQQYSAPAGQVLEILLLGQVFAIANLTSSGIAYGLGKHRPVAMWACVEALANLALSILLVRPLGLAGVAWGTVVPSLAVQILFWPQYVCRLTGMPVRHYLWQAWIRPGLTVIPFGVVSYIVDRVWPPGGLPAFLLQVLVTLPLFPLSVAVCFWSEVRGPLARGVNGISVYRVIVEHLRRSRA